MNNEMQKQYWLDRWNHICKHNPGRSGNHIEDLIQEFIVSDGPKELNRLFTEDNNKFIRLFTKALKEKLTDDEISFVTAYAKNFEADISQRVNDADEKEVMMEAFNKVRKIFEGREWIMEGRGSYRYDDDRYKEEVRYMYDEFDALQTDTWKNIKSKTFEYRKRIIADYLKEQPGNEAKEILAELVRLKDVKDKIDLMSPYEQGLNNDKIIQYRKEKELAWGRARALLYPNDTHDKPQLKLQIRFNRENNGSTGFWRVIYDGVEHLADNVHINVPVHATHDDIGGGVIKSHFTCFYNHLRWTNKDLVVN